jgi:hypothetical protein
MNIHQHITVQVLKQVFSYFLQFFQLQKTAKEKKGKKNNEPWGKLKLEQA